MLAVAEALGSSNNSRVIDLWQNSGSLYTPGYAIYENGALARLALMNFMDPAGGGVPVTATVSVGGAAFGEQNAVPAQVRVK